MGDVIVWRVQKVTGSDFAFVILQISVMLHLADVSKENLYHHLYGYLLYSDPEMGQLSVVSEPLALLFGDSIHIEHIPLPCT